MAAFAIALSVVACAPPDSFYEDPAALPGIPGAVARSFPVTSQSGTYQEVVLYQSTDAAGQPNLVSGIVIVPSTPWSGAGPRPLVAIGPGAQGFSDSCATSKGMAGGYDYNQAFVNPMIDQGFAVAMTDYDGLGTPGGHTYSVADPAGYSVLDVARAALSLPGAGLEADAPVGLFGYSQGGQAAARAAELQPTYAPDLNVVGAFVGGAATDSWALVNPANPFRSASYVAFAALGLNNAYPELDLFGYLNAEGRQVFEELNEQCFWQGVVNTVVGEIGDYAAVDPLTQPEWQDRFAWQAIGFVKPDFPVMVAHSAADDFIPYAQGTGLRDRWCLQGATVAWYDMPLVDHLLGGGVAVAEGAEFLSDRFQGQPVDAYCG